MLYPARFYLLSFCHFFFFFKSSYKYDNVSRSSWSGVDCWDNTVADNGQRGRSLPRHAIYQSWTHADGSNTHIDTHTHIPCTHTCTTQESSQTSRTAAGQTHSHRVAYSDVFACVCSFLEQPKSPQEPSFTPFFLLASMLGKACQGVQQHNAACAFPLFSLLCLSPVCLSPYLPVPLFSLTVQNPYRSIAAQFCLSFCFWFVFAWVFVPWHSAPPNQAFLPVYTSWYVFIVFIFGFFFMHFSSDWNRFYF